MPCITRCCGVKPTATGLHRCSNNIIYQISFQKDRCCLYCIMLRYLWVAVDSTNCCLLFSLQVVAHHSHQPATLHLNPCPHFDLHEGWMNFITRVKSYPVYMVYKPLLYLTLKNIVMGHSST